MPETAPFRPPPRPLGVLDPRRRVPHSGPRRAGRGARDAGRRAHRPRLPRRHDRPRQGGPEERDQARHRLRGLRRRRPPRPEEGLRAPDAPRGDDRRLREPRQALLARLPRGLLLQAARRLGAARAPRRRPHRALRLPLRPRVQGARGEPPRRRRERARPPRPDLRPRRVYVELQNAHLDVQQRIIPAARRARRQAQPADSSRPATSTTSCTTTRARTRRSSASSPATR